jgi:hypothetical protein
MLVGSAGRPDTWIPAVTTRYVPSCVCDRAHVRATRASQWHNDTVCQQSLLRDNNLAQRGTRNYKFVYHMSASTELTTDLRLERT